MIGNQSDKSYSAGLTTPNTLSGFAESTPVGLLEVLGRSVLQRTIDSLVAAGIPSIHVVAGFEKELPAYAQESLGQLENATLVSATASGVCHTLSKSSLPSLT